MRVEAATKSVKTRRNSLLRKGNDLQMEGTDVQRRGKAYEHRVRKCFGQLWKMGAQSGIIYSWLSGLGSLVASPRSFPLEQGTYMVENKSTGSFPLFIVPVYPRGNGMCYEAVFNRLES